MERRTLLIVGHGSRDGEANVEFEALVTQYQALHPELQVRHAYVELAAPSLSEGLSSAAQLSRDVAVLPLFLFAAGHVKNDIPLALAAARKAHPEVRFTAARALGVHPALAELLYQRVEGLRDLTDKSDEKNQKRIASGDDDNLARNDAAVTSLAKTSVIVVGRGSSDADANGDFCKLVRLFGEGYGFAWSWPSFIGIARPSFEETAELAARARPERLIVAPYFLFAGKLIEKLRGQAAAFSKRYPWIKIEVAAHLGIDGRLFRVMDERVAEALEGSASPLPCDNCQFRLPLPAAAEQAGGLKALLWSLRHSYTHTQAVPHVHAHKPIHKHVLVCGNIDCAERGSISLLEMLRRHVRDAGAEQKIRITRAACLGRCGEGPTVAVYPDGVWYRGVQESDANELVQEHLLRDKLVARLVDNIMQ